MPDVFFPKPGELQRSRPLPGARLSVSAPCARWPRGPKVALTGAPRWSQRPEIRRCERNSKDVAKTGLVPIPPIRFASISRDADTSDPSRRRIPIQ
eukprot:5691785-Pyramimonas_sp.AAC.1